MFKNDLHTSNKITQEIDKFTADPGMEADRVANAEIHKDYSKVFTRISCF